VAVAPPGRKTLLVYAGSDTDHKPMKDMWMLDVAAGVWTEQIPRNNPPPPRHCFSAVLVGDAMWVYGGFRLADLWAYSLRDMRWKLLSDKGKEDSPDHPGIRAAHDAAVGPSGDEMYVYGGFRFANDVSDSTRFAHGKLSDLWRFCEASGWTSVPQQEMIGGRQFFTLNMVPRYSEDTGVDAEMGLAVTGGTKCNPNCSLVGETDFYSFNEQRWSTVNLRRVPLHRYHHTVVPHMGYLWIFGGESFDPYMYHNAVERLSWPPPRPESHVNEL